MRCFAIITTGLVCIGMTAFALANPAMLPKHPGYPSSGEFANDTGRTNLTYSQSVEAAALSGDTTMGTMPIDPKRTGIRELQIGDPLKGPVERPVMEGAQMPKK